MDEKHPLMREAVKSLHDHRESLTLWEEKLKELRLKEAKEEAVTAEEEA